MKKLILSLVFLCIGTVMFSEENIVTSDITAESLQVELSQTVILKEHYKKMAIYSEREKELALISLDNEKRIQQEQDETIETLKSVIDELNLVIVSNRKTIQEGQNNLQHYETLVGGYETQLYETIRSTEELIAKSNARVARVENDFNTKLAYLIYIFLVIAVLQIFNLVRQLLAPKVTPTENETESTESQKLKAVPKKEKSKSKPAKPTNTKKEKIKPFSIFIDEKRANADRKRKAKLEKRKAEALTIKDTDQVEEKDTIVENNRNLLKGPLSNFISAVLGIKPKPVKDEKTTPKESKPSEGKTKPTNKPKGKVKVVTKGKKANVTSTPKKGDGGGTNDSKKPTTKPKDKK